MYVAPDPATLESYMKDHEVPTVKWLKEVWFEKTAIYSTLCELLVAGAKVKRKIAMDATYKVMSRMGVVLKGSRSLVRLPALRLLLLAINEIGQIIYWSPISSENSGELKLALKSILLNNLDIPNIPNLFSTYLVADENVHVPGYMDIQQGQAIQEIVDDTVGEIMEECTPEDEEEEEEEEEEGGEVNEAEFNDFEAMDEQNSIDLDEVFDVGLETIPGTTTRISREYLLSPNILFPSLNLAAKDLLACVDNVEATRKMFTESFGER
jgi:hypothetical protein